MKCIRLAALGSFPEIEITDNEIENIKQAQIINNEIMAIEEKFDFIVGNFFDLQKALLENALTESITPEFTINSYFTRSRFYNRYLINFLTTSKLYLDQIPSNIKKIDLRIFSQFENDIASVESAKYCNKIMKIIRNFSQHAGIPTYGDVCFTRVHNTENDPLFFYSNMKLKTEDIKKDRKAREVMSNITDLPNDIELSQLIYDHFQSLNSIHINLRELLKKKREFGQQTIDSYIDKYCEVFPELRAQEQKVLMIIENDKTGILLKFSRNVLEVIDELEKKNKIHNNINNFVISDITNEQIMNFKSNN